MMLEKVAKIKPFATSSAPLIDAQCGKDVVSSFIYSGPKSLIHLRQPTMTVHQAFEQMRKTDNVSNKAYSKLSFSKDFSKTL